MGSLNHCEHCKQLLYTQNVNFFLRMESRIILNFDFQANYPIHLRKPDLIIVNKNIVNVSKCLIVDSQLLSNGYFVKEMLEKMFPQSLQPKPI